MRIVLSAICVAVLGLSAPTRAARAGGGLPIPETAEAEPDPCADLGSFVVVDPPGRPSGGLRAQSYSPCADLAGRRPGEDMRIGVDIMIGGPQPQRPLVASPRAPAPQVAPRRQP